MLMSLTAIMSKHLASGQAAQDELAFDESGLSDQASSLPSVLE